MRSRPEVELRLPGAVHPGATFTVALTLTSASKTPIDGVDVELLGVLDTRTQLQNQMSRRREIVRQTVTVAGKGELDEGRHDYEASFELPSDAPPSYYGTLIECHYTVRVHVTIPWWPDASELKDLTVTRPSIPRKPRAPTASSSLLGNAPFVEIALDDTSHSPGDTITGAVAFGNLGGRATQTLDISLVGFETVTHAPDDEASVGRILRLDFGGSSVYEAHRFTSLKNTSARDEGRELPFRFAVPSQATPAFDVGHASLFWVLEAQIFSDTSVASHAVPVTIGLFDRPAGSGPARPRVGEGRWREVWSAAGAREGLDLDPLHLELQGRIGGCEVSIRIAEGRDGKGALEAALTRDTWGIEFDVAPKKLFEGGIPTGDARFEQRLRLQARDPDQARAALTPTLRDALLAFDEVTVDDERASARKDAPGYDQPWIGEFVAMTAALARALAEAEMKIPPPPSMIEHLPAWRRFADELGGALVVGAMRIRGGRLDGVPFTISTRFDRRGAPERTRLRMEVDPPLPSALDPDDPAAIAAAPPPAREILAALKKQETSLVIEAGKIVADHAGPVADPGSLRATMSSMIALAAAIRGERRAGPYR